MLPQCRSCRVEIGSGSQIANYFVINLVHVGGIPLMARHRKTYTGERRTVHLGVQLTPSERAELELAATEAGASLSQYVRELCLRRAAEAATVGGARRNPEAKRLLHELSAIGNNLNQLARVANTKRQAPQEVELRATIEVLKAAMARVLSL